MTGMLLEVDTPEWMYQGLCNGKDTDIWFPVGVNEEEVEDLVRLSASSRVTSYNEARPVCDACPVRGLCLEYALQHRIKHGMWGGTSPRERQRILKRRAIKRAS